MLWNKWNYNFIWFIRRRPRKLWSQSGSIAAVTVIWLEQLLTFIMETGFAEVNNEWKWSKNAFKYNITYKLDIHCTTVLYQLTYSFLQSLCLILPQFYGIVWNIGVLKVSLDPLCHQLPRFIIVDFIGPSLTSNHDVTNLLKVQV